MKTMIQRTRTWLFPRSILGLGLLLVSMVGSGVLQQAALGATPNGRISLHVSLQNDLEEESVSVIRFGEALKVRAWVDTEELDEDESVRITIYQDGKAIASETGTSLVLEYHNFDDPGVYKLQAVAVFSREGEPDAEEWTSKVSVTAARVRFMRNGEDVDLLRVPASVGNTSVYVGIEPASAPIELVPSNSHISVSGDGPGTVTVNATSNGEITAEIIGTSVVCDTVGVALLAYNVELDLQGAPDVSKVTILTDSGGSKVFNATRHGFTANDQQNPNGWSWSYTGVFTGTGTSPRSTTAWSCNFLPSTASGDNKFAVTAHLTGGGDISDSVAFSTSKQVVSPHKAFRARRELTHLGKTFPSGIDPGPGSISVTVSASVSVTYSFSTTTEGSHAVQLAKGAGGAFEVGGDVKAVNLKLKGEGSLKQTVTNAVAAALSITEDTTGALNIGWNKWYDVEEDHYLAISVVVFGNIYDVSALVYPDENEDGFADGPAEHIEWVAYDGFQPVIRVRSEELPDPE